MKGVKFIYSSHAINRFNSRFPNHNLKAEAKTVQHCSTEDLKSLKSSNSYKRAKRQNPRDLRFFRSDCGAYFVCRVEKIIDEIEYTKVITIIRNSKQESADHMQQMILEMYDRRLENEKRKERQRNDKKSKGEGNSSQSDSVIVDSTSETKCSPAHQQKSMKKGVVKSTILELGMDSDLPVFSKKSSAYVKNLSNHITMIEDDQTLLNLNYLISRNMIQARRCLMKLNGEYAKQLNIPKKYESYKDAFVGLINESRDLNRKNPLFFRVVWKQMFKSILNNEQWVARKTKKIKKKSKHPIDKMNNYVRTLSRLKMFESNFASEEIEMTESLLAFETEVMTNIYTSGEVKQEDVFSILDRLYMLEPVTKKAGLSTRFDAILNFYTILDKQMFDSGKTIINLQTSQA